MIILDTHIWVWWLHDAPQLPAIFRDSIETYIDAGLGVSAISCWEVAKLVERNRLHLPMPVESWLTYALSEPGIRLLPPSPQICVESTRLPAPFHKDPADQIIVATARSFDCPLVTLDGHIRNYPHVKLLL